jgi:predicted RND superfamily exporter protein
MVVRQRWWIIATTLLIFVAAASGVTHLTVSNDMRVFFSEKNPQLQALDALENTYTKNESVFFVLAPKDGNVFTRTTLAAVDELTESSWKIPYSSRVDSIANFQHTWAQEDDLIVEDLVEDADSMSEADLDRVRETALTEPLLVNRLISPSGHVTGVVVNILKPGESLDEVPKVTAFARELADGIREKYPDIDVHLTGSIVIDNAFGEATFKDWSTLIPAMFLALVIILGVTLRSFVGTATTFIIIVISMITGMGLAGWLGMVVTAASANAPIIIMTLAVADSVHILTTLLQRMRQGDSKHKAIAESVRINLMPVLITSVTTAIGFLSMNFSDAPPFRTLGNIVAMGVMAAFLYSAFFLPAALAVLPLRTRARPEKSNFGNCDWLANLVINNRKLIFLATLAVMVVVALGTTRIELNDEWIKYFDESYEIRQATDFTTRNMTGFDTIEYSLQAGEEGGINNPEYLAKVEDFANWYGQQPKVVHVSAITDIMKRLNMNMHGDDKSWYRVPDQSDLAAQYLLLYEMSLPFGLDLNNQIDVDKSSTRVTVLMTEASTRELRQTDERARAWLAAHAPESMFTYGSGLTVMWSHISERNINSMLGGSFLALLLISVIMIAALRSFKIGVLSLIPNLAPAIMAFGVWGLIKGQVGLGLSIIVSMTIGIVVDDTVHFLSKYLRARREFDLDPAGAVRYSFNTVGTAMWVTTAALVTGFMILSFSGFKMNADMALMTAITISLALAMDFLFLPTLLMKLEERKDEISVIEGYKNMVDGRDADFVGVPPDSSGTII